MSGDKPSERQLLTELEKGDDTHLKTFFSGEFEERRLASIRILQDLFDHDVKAGSANGNSLSFRSPHWYTQGIEVSRDGNAIYRDVFTTSKLQHSDPADPVPANRQPLDMEQIRRVTTDLENGRASLMKALTGTYIEEGVRYLHAVESVNAQDLQAGRTKASLSVGYDGHKMFPMKVSVSRSVPGFWNALSGPVNLYEKGWDAKNSEQYVNMRDDTREPA